MMRSLWSGSVLAADRVLDLTTIGQGGDDCLRQLARVLSGSICRTGDQVARYGGEEFSFIAPATDAGLALGLALRDCVALRALALSHTGSSFGVVTASFGVASLHPGDRNSPATLLHAADQALYAARLQGRNRALLAEGEGTRTAHAESTERS